MKLGGNECAPDTVLLLHFNSSISTCSTARLRRSYNDRTIVLTLPDEITIYDFDWFLVWCVPFSVNFGEVQIPDNPEFVEQVVEVPTLPPIEECIGVSIVW